MSVQEPQAPAASPRLGDAYWAELSRIAERPPTTATEVTPLRDNAAAFAARISAMDAAKKSLIATTYLIEPDDFGFAYLEGLLRAQKRGVCVTLSLDFVAERYTKRQYEKAARERFDGLLHAIGEAGGFVSWYAYPRDQLHNPGHGQHYKSLIIDGERAIVGGRNIGASYFKDWTDFDMAVRGPIVTQLADAALTVLSRSDAANRYAAFTTPKIQRRAYALALAAQRATVDAGAARALAEAKAALAAGQTLARFQFVFYDPTHDAKFLAAAPAADASRADPPVRSRVTEALKDTFDEAEKQIVATSIYCNPVPQLRDTLSAAAERGAEVLLSTTGRRTPGWSTPSFLNAMRSVGVLLDAGADVVETERFEHGKLYCIDDRVAAFGSYNMEHPADRKLAEGLLFSDDARVVAAVKAAALDTIENRAVPAKPLLPPDIYPPLGRWARVIQRGLATLVQPFA